MRTMSSMAIECRFDGHAPWYASPRFRAKNRGRIMCQRLASVTLVLYRLQSILPNDRP